MKKTQLASLILLAAVMAAAVSCGETTAPADTDTEPDSAPETEAVTEPSEFTPEPGFDCGGAAFIIAENDVDDWMQSAFVEEENADILNDSIYRRNTTVEDMYNVDVKGYVIEGGRNVQNLSSLTQSILAGDKEFDIAYIPGELTPVILNQPDYLIPLSDIDTLDLTHSWWDQASVEAMTILGRTISATGDLIVSTTGSSTITLFNKRIASDNDIDIYDVVRSGKFTFAEMYELSKDIKADLNGDGKMVPDDDRYGISYESMNLDMFILAAGEHLTGINKDGVPELTLDKPRVAEIIQHFIGIADDLDVCCGSQETRMKDVPLDNCFNEDRLFLWITNLQRMKSARSYTTDFGLVPFPKYEESGEYSAPVNVYWSSWLIVPTTQDDTDRCGTVLDALGYYSQQYVTPAFIETSVTTKSLRDDDSAEMLEMVLGNKVFDIGCYFDWGYRLVYSMASNHNKDVASALASGQAKIETSIAAFIEAYTSKE